MQNLRFRRLPGRAASLLLLGLAALAQAKAPVFTLTALALPDVPPDQLSTLTLLGINDRGQVLGEYIDARAIDDDQNYHGWHTVYWDRDGSLTEIGRYSPYQTCRATSINNDGKIVGTCSMTVPNLPPGEGNFIQAFLWDPRHGFRGLAKPFRSDKPGGLFPAAINDRAAVAGYTLAKNPAALYGVERQTVITVPTRGTRDPVPGDLANAPTDLNNALHYTFTEAVDSRVQGRRGGLGDAKTGTTIDISPVPGSTGDIKVVPLALNNQDVAVGFNFLYDAPLSMQSFIWDAVNGARDLGTFYPRLNVSRCAVDINDAGQVIGQDDRVAYYYDAEVGMKKLNQLIDPADPRAADFRIRLSYCDYNNPKFGYINNQGEIAVMNAAVAGYPPFRLTPK